MRSNDNPKQWPKTQWSLIEEVANEDASAKSEALENLISTYLPALRAHLVFRRSISEEMADDFIQEFFIKKFLESNIAHVAEPAKGKFRNLLLRSLENHLRDYFRSKAHKQDRANVELEVGNFDNEHHSDDDVFVKAWACGVFNQAVDHFRIFCEQNERTHQWLVYRERMLRPVFFRQETPSYDEIASGHPDLTADQARMLLHKAKNNFAKSLRSVIGQYIEDADEIEQEISELLQVLKNTDNLDEQIIPFLKRDQIFENEHSPEFRSQYASFVFEPETTDDFDPECWEDILSLDASLVLDDEHRETIAGVIFSTAPSVSEISIIKDFAKRNYKSRSKTQNSAKYFLALYALCIATGLYKCDQRLCDLEPKAIESIFAQCMTKSWIDPKTKQYISIATKFI